MNVNAYIATIDELSRRREAIDMKLEYYVNVVINAGCLITVWLALFTFFGFVIGVDFTLFTKDSTYIVIVPMYVTTVLAISLYTFRKFSYKHLTGTIEKTIDQLLNTDEVRELDHKQWNTLTRAGWDVTTDDEAFQVYVARQTKWIFNGTRYVKQS